MVLELVALSSLARSSKLRFELGAEFPASPSSASLPLASLSLSAHAPLQLETMTSKEIVLAQIEDATQGCARPFPLSPLSSSPRADVPHTAGPYNALSHFSHPSGVLAAWRDWSVC